VAHLPSTSLTYVRTRCTSAVYIATYARTRCRTSLVFTAVLHSYALPVCCQHRRPPFVRVAEPRWYSPLSYIRTRGTSAIYIADLHSYALHVCRLHRDLRLYALQNLVGNHRCPTFVRAARLPSTSPTSIRTPCRTSLVRTMSDICMSSASASITAGYIRTRCSSAVNIAELRSYALQNLVCMCRCPTLVRAAPLPSTSLTYVRTWCRTSLEFTSVLHSYALLLYHQHRRPPFLRIAEPRLYVPLSYIRTRCSSSIYIADLRLYARQNLVGIHDCPTFVRDAPLPSTSPTSVLTHCLTTLLRTSILHSYIL